MAYMIPDIDPAQLEHASEEASVLTLKPGIFARAPSGMPLRLLPAENQRHQKQLVIEELMRLLQREELHPHQIAVIGPAAKAKGSLADVSEVCRVPLVTDTEAWRDGAGVLVTTARLFKGLEADIVILYGLDKFGRLYRKEDLYVSCTRSKALLVAVVHGDEVREVMARALSAAGAQL